MLEELCPRVEVAVIDPRRIPGVLFGLDGIVIGFFSAEVCCGETCFGAFVEIVEAPVLTVDEEMEVPSARVGVPHGALDLAGDLFSDEGVVPIAPERPGVVLSSPEIDLFEVGRALIAEERVSQWAPVSVTEIELESVLWIVSASAEATADAYSAIGLKASSGMKWIVQELDRGRAFPGQTAIVWVDPDATRGIEKIFEIGD